MTSKYKSEGNLFLTYKTAPDTHDLYDPSLIGVTYTKKNSEISLNVLTSKTGIKSECAQKSKIFKISRQQPKIKFCSYSQVR